MVIGSRKIAIGFFCAHSRWDTETQPSCSSVVPYRCMCRRIAIAAGPATWTKPVSADQSAVPPIGVEKLALADRWLVPYVHSTVLAWPDSMAIAARCNEKAQAP